MTAIFISHSSIDNKAAADMMAWLESQGHTSLFLDFDPETGISAGDDWEQTLYTNLRKCQAVIAMVTPDFLASKWCFAELVQAREGGKAIFPVKVKPCDASRLLRDVQQIDLTDNVEDGYSRLAIALKQRGLDPLDIFDWDPNRPLYPGLSAFKEEDAAIFFGRGEEILNGLETLDRLRNRGRGAPKFALLLGASGSGKSSLARAGLIPRLKKSPTDWLPLNPFRPQDNPIDELALAISATFKSFGLSRGWREIQQTLNAAANQESPDGRVLIDLARELSIAAEQPDATVLITIDQAEELFGYSDHEAAGKFLRLLRAALEISDRQLLVMATMRSDFLGEFQTHPALQDASYEHDFRYQAVPVAPMPERNFAEIIEGPARLGGLKFEDGLVGVMVEETTTRDALPLLAFTLRRLYERHGKDGLLEISEYDQIGRLEGAIKFEAERILNEAKPSTQDLEALRTAFVPAMVRINTEGGFARRRAYIEEIPAGARKLLDRFVESRLLVSGMDKDSRATLEVSHEALLRTWPQLNAWLAEDQDKLRLLEGLQSASKEWDEHQRPDDLLVHRGSRLRDVGLLVSTARFALADNSPEKPYLKSCLEAQQALEASEREDQERRVRDAEKIAEEQSNRVLAQAKMVKRTRFGLVASLLLLVVAGWQYWEATDAAETAVLALKSAAESAEDANQAKEVAVPWMVRSTWRSGNEYNPPKGWVTGARAMIEYADPIINLDKVRFLSPFNIFESGPHQSYFDWESDNFGHYNPDFVNWVHDHMIPGAEDNGFRQVTQPFYDKHLAVLARSYCRTYQAMHHDPEVVDQLKTEYLAYLDDSSLGFSFNGGRFSAYSNPMGYIEPGLFSTHAHVAAGFWLRREIDGTADEFITVIRKVLETYDQAYARECESFTTPFSSALLDGLPGTWIVREAGRTVVGRTYVIFNKDGGLTVRNMQNSTQHQWKWENDQLLIDNIVVNTESYNDISITLSEIPGYEGQQELSRLYNEQTTAQYDTSGEEVDQYNATVVDIGIHGFYRTEPGYWVGPDANGDEAEYIEAGRGMFGIYLYNAALDVDIQLDQYDGEVKMYSANGETQILGEISSFLRPQH